MNLPEEPGEQPGTVFAVLRIVAEAEVIPGPETLAAQAAADNTDEEPDE